MLLWALAFLIPPTLLLWVFIAYFFKGDPEAPNDLPFLLIGCCFPVSALIGFVLALNGRLPGTKRQP